MELRMIMPVSFLIIVVICQQICHAKESTETDDTSAEKFVPTSDWQKVKRGQPLPAGLHYRINMYSGETEAKLLDSNEQQSSKTSLTALPNEGSKSEPDNKLYMSKEELKRVLAEVNANNGDNQDNLLNNDEQTDEKKYRSYEDLKKEFGSLNLTVKTDMEILNELVSKGKMQLIGNADEEEIATTLKDLEYLVHQIDNGKEFIRLRGLENIIIPALNSSSSKIRAESLWLVGSATQSNPQVQIAVLHSGIMQKLVKVAVLDSNSSVRARAIYALSCLTRQFPAAQEKLMNEGGLDTLSGIIDSESFSDFKTKMRVITLINDLMVERISVRKALDEHKQVVISHESEAAQKIHNHKQNELIEKLRQYSAINLEKRLVEAGWCFRLPEFLCKLHESGTNAGRTQRRDDLGSVMSEDIPYRPEHDAVEKVTGTLLVLNDICLQEFHQHSKLEKVLEEFFSWYQDLSIREEMLQMHGKDASEKKDHLHYSIGETFDNNMYYTSIAETLKELIRRLKRQNISARKEREEL